MRFIPFVISSVVCSLLVTPTVFGQGRGGGTGGNGGRSTGTAVRADAGGDPTTTSGSGLPSANDEGKIQFRTQSILVQVPVIITDKGGNHVHGLGKGDIHIFENGKEQPISVLEEQTASSAGIALPKLPPGEFQNLTIAEDKPRSVTVVALDTVNTPFLDQAQGRRELVKYLSDNMNSGQVMALVLMTSNGLKVVQGLTGDPAQLAQVLKKVSGEPSALLGSSRNEQADVSVGTITAIPTSVPPGTDPTIIMQEFIEHGDEVIAQFQQQNAIEVTLDSFMGIAMALSGVPGHKTVIWATGGFPFNLESPATVPGGYLSVLYERTMQALLQGQISVYPVDVRGLVNVTMPGGRRSRPLSTDQMTKRMWRQEYTTDTMDEFAEMTGGKAFYNTNDLATSFKRAADDASSYYLVGYYLDTHNDKAGWRNLKVKVDRKDVEVRARKGFFVTNATLNMAVSHDSDLRYALTSPIEGTGVPVDVKWNGVSGDGATKKAAFVVHLPFNGLAFDPTGTNKLNFDFAAAVYPANSKETKPSTTLAKTFTPSLTDAQIAAIRASGVGFNYAFDLSPGQYAVRFVVRDNVTGKIGSVTAPLTVN